MFMFFVVLALCFWLCGFIILYHIPTCHEQKGKEKDYPTISIIVPARNEETNIPRLLTSIQEQQVQPTEVIVIDDHSTDQTRERAEALGARVISAQTLPKGWVGKTWACYQGAQAAQGKILMFLDADTFFEPGGFCRAMDTFLHEQGVLSIGPFHRTKRPYEQLSAIFNLILMAGMNCFTIFGNRWKPTGLFGPSLITSRKDYFAVGGHERVKDKILEDLFLGEEYFRAGIPIHLYGGRHTLSFRMYPHGLRDLINGWSKAFATGAQKTAFLPMTLIILWITGIILTLAGFLVAFVHDPISASAIFLVVYFMFVVQVYWMLRQIGTFFFLTALLIPVPLFFFFIVFTRSLFLVLFKKSVTWKDRGINVDSKS